MNEEKLERLDQIPERPDLSLEILEIIKGNYTDSEIRDKLSLYHENDIAEVIPDLSVFERKKLYKVLGVELVSEIFAYLEDVAPRISSTACFHSRKAPSLRCSPLSCLRKEGPSWSNWTST